METSHAAVREAESQVTQITRRLLEAKGTRSVDSFHRELGKIMWEHCGMARNAAGLKKALAKIPPLREQFWRDVKILGSGDELNQSLEKAGRVADFFELAELMCLDALERNESCGGHFREEYQTPEGEAARDDEQLFLRRRLGISRRGPAARAAQRAADFRIRAPGATELQMRIILHIWRQKNADDKGRMVALRSAQRQRAHVVPGDARRPERGPASPRAKSRWPSTTIAARASAACAAAW